MQSMLTHIDSIIIFLVFFLFFSSSSPPSSPSSRCSHLPSLSFGRLPPPPPPSSSSVMSSWSLQALRCPKPTASATASLPRASSTCWRRSSSSAGASCWPGAPCRPVAPSLTHPLSSRGPRSSEPVTKASAARLKKLVRGGIPAEARPRVWMELSGAEAARVADPQAYANLCLAKINLDAGKSDKREERKKKEVKNE